jgi:hypothetical protein
MSIQLSKHATRAAVCALSLMVLCTVAVSIASAQTTWDKKTTVTFTTPVEIPGVGTPVLPAGTYVFKLLDSSSDRHIVQIFNEDGSHMYATVLALPNRRLKATDKTVITFAERAAGNPQAIKAWFYPGDTSGQEFVYSKTKAIALAAAAREPVLYMPDEAASNITAPVTLATDAPVVALKQVPVVAVNPRGEDVPIADVVQPVPTQSAAQLPHTASPMPLLALMGLLSVGLGFGVKLRSSFAR